MKVLSPYYMMGDKHTSCKLSSFDVQVGVGWWSVIAGQGWEPWSPCRPSTTPSWLKWVAMPCYYCPHGLLILKEMNPEYSLEGISFLSPGVCSNSCLLSWWCYLTTSSYATLFSFCLQSFPASASFPMSQLFASGGQSIEASASVLPMNIQGSFPLRLTGLISLLSKGLSTFFSNTIVQKHQFFSAQLSLLSNRHIRVWLLGKPQLWLCGPWDKWGQRKNREFAITLFPESQGPAIWLLLSVSQSLMFVFYIKAKVFSCTWQEKLGKTMSTPSSQKQKSVIEFLKNQVGTKLLLWLALKTKVRFGKWWRQNKLIFSITFTKMIDLTNSKPVFYFQIKLKFAVKIATDMQIIKYKTRDFLT